MEDSQTLKNTPPPYEALVDNQIHPFGERYPIEVSISDSNTPTNLFVKYIAKTYAQLGLILKGSSKEHKWTKLTFNTDIPKKYSGWISCLSGKYAHDFLLKYTQFAFTEEEPKSSWKLFLIIKNNDLPLDQLSINHYDFKRLMETFKGHAMFYGGDGISFKFSAVSPDETITFIEATPTQILKELAKF